MQLLALIGIGLIATCASSWLTISIGATEVYLGDAMLLLGLGLARSGFYKQRSNLLIAAVVMATSITTQTYNSPYSWIFYVTGMLALVGSAAERRRSLPGAIGHGLYAFSIGWCINLMHMWRSLPRLLGRFQISKREALISFLPFVLTLLFVNLYSSANQSFGLLFSVPAGWLSDSNLAAMIGSWCWFSVISNVFIFPIHWRQLGTWESDQREQLQPQGTEEEAPSPREPQEFEAGPVEPFLAGHEPLLTLSEQQKLATMLLGGLNGLLVLFHLTDLATLFGGVLPQSMSYSAYLHQGINTLMLSMALAVLIVMTIFNGELNFSKQAETIKRLSRIWLWQNLALVATSIWKVTWYIDVYGLTPKRVGVLAVLMMILGTLGYTLSKVRDQTSLWAWTHQNTAWAMGVCGFFGVINWTQVITSINLHTELEVKPDLQHLLQLHNPDYQSIAEHLIAHPEQQKTALLEELERNRGHFSSEDYEAVEALTRAIQKDQTTANDLGAMTDIPEQELNESNTVLGLAPEESQTEPDQLDSPPIDAGESIELARSP